MPHQPLHLDLGTRLLVQAKFGDRQAFDQVYSMYGRAVHDFLARGNGSLGHHVLEDLVQEVFFRAWDRCSGYANEASAKTWVFGIARKVAWEWHRQQPPSMPLHEQLSKQDAVGQALVNRERAQALHDAVALLPPKQRQAIELVYFDELGPAKAALMANCNEPALRRRLADARARLRLRRVLRDEAGD